MNERLIIEQPSSTLDRLEAQSVHILREAYREFKSLVMLWSIGKDSTVLLWLTRKAFFGHVPFPLLHIDTGYKIPEMIRYRDDIVRQWRLNMIVGQNVRALAEKRTFPDGRLTRLECCKTLKTEALKCTLSGEWPRRRFDHAAGRYVQETHGEAFTGVIVGVRADEEGLATGTATGTRAISRRSCGTSTRPTSLPGRIFASTPCWTGLSWTSGSISAEKRFP
jgi:sulfate adenylyltransferase subunit 2